MKNSYNLLMGFNLIKDFWTWKIITSKAIHFTKDHANNFLNKEFLMIKKFTW
jgi:hypothetical protein